jgi:pilus assembly protein CpaB
MAAQLPPGYRAVAVEIEAETAAGGYIQPNDRVDVIATARVNNRDAGGERVNSSIIIEDVRVLALGDTTQTQTSGEAPQTINAPVAVLELTAQDAAALAQAEELGTVSLALRGVHVETVGMRTPHGRSLSQQSGAVLLHQYGTVSGGGR